MSSDRIKSQTQFEINLSSTLSKPFNDITERELKAYIITGSDKTLYDSAFESDARDFYYKGLLSLYEGLISTERKLFSWATIKIYYSLFYLIRATLCCSGISFIRKERDAFYFINSIGESPKKIPGTHKSDHRGAIYLIKTFLGSTDFLQSNQIDGKNTYEWVMYNRENINYKFRTFFEPDIPIFWDNIAMQLKQDGIEYWINTYIRDDIYCFLEDHAILATPLRRLILSHNAFKAKGYPLYLEPVKLQNLKEISGEYVF